MSGGFFDDVEIPFPCPDCGHKTGMTVAELRVYDSFACNKCGKTVKVKDLVEDSDAGDDDRYQ